MTSLVAADTGREWEEGARVVRSSDSRSAVYRDGLRLGGMEPKGGAHGSVNAVNRTCLRGLLLGVPVSALPLLVNPRVRGIQGLGETEQVVGPEG